MGKPELTKLMYFLFNKKSTTCHPEGALFATEGSLACRDKDASPLCGSA